MSSATSWRDALKGQMPPEWAEEIDRFEGQMELRRQNKIDEKVFAESRLRRGAYGQRYDNGQRHDGVRSRALAYPDPEITKGPDTLWHAPGMQRIKIPFGGLTPEQLEVIADLADEYSNGVLHVTTRQDFQLHFVHIEDAPDLMRRLAAVGITTLEACGNVVRNVTACHRAGVCRTETFDVTPYAKALAFFLLGHDDAQDFGRKVKIAFSGCEREACGLVRMHDIGYLARVKEANGERKRGFALYVGGGLGTIPYQAKLLSDFVPEEEILPLAQAIARVFARLGEKRNRNRARLKFLVAKLGIEEFRRLVFAEREALPYDERWTAYLDSVASFQETPPTHPGEKRSVETPAEGYEAWLTTNVYAQRQPGYHLVTVHLPLGDLSSTQARALADIARRYAGGHMRLTDEQNIALRWVADADLPALHQELSAIGLGNPGAGTICDITACPGASTCKLGIAASRGLANELRSRLESKNGDLPDAVKALRIKISGCFNSCGRHHVADIGFFGNSRRHSNRAVPHFQVVLGGDQSENGAAYGLAVGAIPSKRAPEFLDALTRRYAAERKPDETFPQWVARLGKKEIKRMLKPFTLVPAYELDPSLYSDWGDPREFSLGDIGVGECAGEVVSLFSFEIAKAEGEAFAALLALDERDYRQADQRAYRAMLLAAKALVRSQNLDVGDDPDRIVAEFKSRFYDTKLFFDPFAKEKFAQYLLERHANPNPNPDEDYAHQIVEEANLFIEAAYACDARMAS
ncbi:MAG: nitrite/sulfite reductase [Chloroflexi bacterium]|nr:nitrite/sulfite reductase [Chloroflexota bacterium]